MLCKLKHRPLKHCKINVSEVRENNSYFRNPIKRKKILTLSSHLKILIENHEDVFIIMDFMDESI